jgi:hypothetical protein
MSKKEKWKKVKNQDSMGKRNFFFSTLPFCPKNSPRTHTELELGVLGIPEKLVKYVVHSSKRKNRKKIIFLTQVAQTAIDEFLVSRNFRG